MRENTEIRALHEGDAEAFLDLLTRIDAETDFMLLEAGERATTVVEQRERIKGVLSKENQTILVASRDKLLVGYLVAIGGEARRIRHRAYVVVGVLQAFTGRQIGTRLFTALESWAKLHGIERLELTVRTDNERGTGLYRKMGCEHTRGDRIDHHQLRRGPSGPCNQNQRDGQAAYDVTNPHRRPPLGLDAARTQRPLARGACGQD